MPGQIPLLRAAYHQGQKRHLTWELSIGTSSLAFFLESFPFKMCILCSSVHYLPLSLSEWVLIAAAVQRLKILPHYGSFISFTAIPQIPIGWRLCDAFKETYMLPLPTTLSLGHPHCMVSAPNYSWSQKRHSSGSACKIPSLESTLRPLDIYFLTMSLLVSTFIFQTFKIYSLKKTIFVFSSCIYTSQRMQAACADVKQTRNQNGSSVYFSNLAQTQAQVEKVPFLLLLTATPHGKFHSPKSSLPKKYDSVKKGRCN